MGEHLGGWRGRGEGLVGGEWCNLKADWLMGSHLGGLQLLDVLVGAIALVMFSSDHTVVGPDRKHEAGL